MSTITQPGLDLGVLARDLEQYAAIAEVKYNREAVHTILDVFGDIFSNSSVTMRTTTHPKEKRELNFRYMEPDIAHNPFRRLRDAGLLKLQGHPVEKVIPEVLSRYRVTWGMDVAA